MKKIIIYTIGFLALAGIVSALASTGLKPSSYSNTKLIAQENQFDFGQIALTGGKARHNFIVKNDGGESVKINKIFTSCMCTTAVFKDKNGQIMAEFGMPGHGAGPASTNLEVGAGEEATIEAVFDPSVHGPAGVGLNQRSIFIETNSKTDPKLELKFQATVVN